MKQIKVIIIGMVLIMICMFSNGCSNTKYNAKLYSNAEEWIDKSFLNENRVKAYYLNENYVEGVSYQDEQYVYENNAPSEKIYIFESDIEFKKIFVNYEKKIDFSKEIVVLYIFADVNFKIDYKLESLKYKNGIVEITARLCKSNLDVATVPYPRCFMIKMDKMKITDVKLELK